MQGLFRDLHDLMHGYRRRLSMMVALFLLVGGLDLVGLGLIGQYVANLVSAKPIIDFDRWAGMIGYTSGNSIHLIGILLIAVFVLKTVVGIAANYFVHSTVGKIEASMRADLLWGYQLMPYRQWMVRNTSEYINAINVWATQCTRFTLIPLIRLASDGLVAVFILLFLAYLDYRAFGIFIGLLAGVGLLYDILLRRKVISRGKRFSTLSARVVTDVRQAMEGLKEIRILGAEKHFNDQIRQNSTELCANLALANTLSQAPRYLVEFAIVVFAVLTVFVITLTGEIAAALIPVFGVFAAGAVRLAPLVSQVSSVGTNLRFYRETIGKLAQDYRLVQSARQSNLYRPSDVATRRFEKLNTRDLWFAYDKATDWALKRVNIEILAGESVVFVGQSGAGKTTLVDILLGLLEPTKGAVSVNDDGPEDSTTLLRGKVGYLPQQVFLIDDTLRRNIALGEPDNIIDDRKILDALRRAKLIDRINDLPGGLDGMLGDRGLRLSGGQRQRVALARAFYFNREIIVLDEATNAVDYETEQAIIDEIMALRGEKTLIAITHRPGVTRRFDKIYRIRKGEVQLEKADKSPFSDGGPASSVPGTKPGKIRALDAQKRK